ncbi:hypothetical protein CK203_110266 [Vitis vinifera]|uniref:Uncharacterized protein n=1 Tax=Vitis vinifera TaxID=29760 RepID=A0A438CFM3_VITVI|nr:hypothetical protein CK203_110266 [Vitis vinifera]
MYHIRNSAHDAGWERMAFQTSPDTHIRIRLAPTRMGEQPFCTSAAVGFSRKPTLGKLLDSKETSISYLLRAFDGSTAGHESADTPTGHESMEYLNEALDAFKVFKAKVEKQCKKQIKIMRMDKGGEYYGRYIEDGQAPGPFGKFLQSMG